MVGAQTPLRNHRRHSQDAVRLHLRSARGDDGQVDAGGRRARVRVHGDPQPRSRSIAITSPWSATSCTPAPPARTPARSTRAPPRSFSAAAVRRKMPCASASRVDQIGRRAHQSGHAAAVARAGHRGSQPELRRRLRLRLLQHDLLAHADRAAAGGEQPAGGVRKAVWRRRHHRAAPARASARTAAFSTRSASRRWRFRSGLPASDRLRVDGYLDDIREIERRIKTVLDRNAQSADPLSVPDAPVGTPGGLRRARQADVRSADAGLPERDHAGLDADVREGPEPGQLSVERQSRRVPRLLASCQRARSAWISSR